MDKRKVSIRELETLVGEHVMNLNIAHDMKVGDVVWFRPQPGALTGLPDYTRDANATRKVIDKLRGEGYLFSFRDYPDFRVAEFQREGGFPYTARGRYDDGVATCLAALATRNIHVEVE